MIDAPTFNHKTGNAAHSGVSVLHEILQVKEPMMNEMNHWKAILRDNVLLKVSNGAPIQDG